MYKTALQVSNIMKNLTKNILILSFVILIGNHWGYAQQDPQYTQYMYNTQVINPGYIGSKDNTSVGLLGRTQWVNFDGAPKTGTLTFNTPLGHTENMAIGASLVHDEIGPSLETNFTIDYAYSIKLSEAAKLSFGVAAGVDVLDVDFSRLNVADQGDIFQSNIDHKLQPQLGLGMYYFTDRFYAGTSLPNVFKTKHFDSMNIDDIINGNQGLGETTAAEELHWFFISGYVFDVSEHVKFKPATMIKAVKGAPLQWDFSANFLLREKITLGAAYRWDAAITAMAGFQASDQIFIGVGYDYQTTDLETYSDGSYEVMFRFDIFNHVERIVTPRFF